MRTRLGMVILVALMGMTVCQQPGVLAEEVTADQGQSAEQPGARHAKEAVALAVASRSLRSELVEGGIILDSELASEEVGATAGRDSGDPTAAPTSKPSKMDSIYEPFVSLLDTSTDYWPENWLTGDWGGLRRDLVDSGIIFEAAVTQIIQGNAHGGKDTSSAFRYSGSVDYYLNFDTGRMNLWPGGVFIIHGETSFSQALNSKVGSLSPPNTDALFPVPGEESATTLSEAFFVQALSKQLFVVAGKADPTRLMDTNVFANSEKTQFLNLGLRNNPTLLPFAPYTTMAGAVIVVPTDWLMVINAVADTNGSANHTGFETAFHSPEGATLAQEYDITIKPFGLTGHQRFGFAYSTKDRLTFGSDRRIGLPGTLRRRTILRGHPLLRLLRLSRGLGLDQRPDDWVLFYNFDQYLYTEKEDPSQGIGIFGRFGWSTGKANPTEAFYSIGISGKGVIPTRDKDTFGLGYYYQDLSDRLVRFDLHSEQGIELYYNIEVTPWLHITPDLQVIINPGGGDNDVAIVYGMRAQMSF